MATQTRTISEGEQVTLDMLNAWCNWVMALGYSIRHHSQRLSEQLSRCDVVLLVFTYFGLSTNCCNKEITMLVSESFKALNLNIAVNYKDMKLKESHRFQGLLLVRANTSGRFQLLLWRIPKTNHAALTRDSMWQPRNGLCNKSSR